MTNSTNTTTSTSTASDSGYVNALQQGWAYVRRVRTVAPSAKSKSKTPTLHAYIAFLGGDGVDCKISGMDAKKLFLNHDLEKLSQANVQIQVQCTVGDVYSDIYKDAEGTEKAARKGRLLKISKLFIDGESMFDDGSTVYEQTTMQASGYLRSARRYNKQGVPTDAVTIQFVHGAKGELNSDSHGLDVTDLALVDMIAPYVDKAQALNPTYDKTVEGSKKYLHSVWVAATAIDCSSKLYKGNDNKTYVGRQGTLKSISCIMVDGEVMYSAKLEREAKAIAQAAADSEAQTQGETAQAAASEVEAETSAQAEAVAMEEISESVAQTYEEEADF